MESGPNQLYRIWEETREAAGADRWALSDLKSGRHWSFGELQEAVDVLPKIEAGSLCCPLGFSVDLVFESLRAWRDGAVLCPVERERDIPDSEKLRCLPSEVCHLKLTSGSTEGPRLVAFTAGQLAADSRKIVSTMGLCPEWPNLGVISMSHSYGFSNLVLPLLLHGIPLAWLGDPLPGSMASTLRDLPDGAKGWTLAAVPALWRAWNEANILGNVTIRPAISAGAPLPVELEQAIHQSTGLKVHNFYGSSECGGIAYDRSDTPRTSGDQAGTAMDETALSVNEDGCLEVRGFSVAMGYWSGGNLLDDQLGKGNFRTSDLATLQTDQNGAIGVTLSGRRDDLINVAGRKVSPASVEAALAAVPGVRQALVFGIASLDPVRGEEIVAVINWLGGEENADAFHRDRKSVTTELAPHEQPRHWWFRDDLAPNARGKLSRHEWRQRYLKSRTVGQKDS